MIDEELLAGDAQRAGNGEEEVLLGGGVAEGGVEDTGEEPSAAEATGLHVEARFGFGGEMRVHAREHPPERGGPQ